MNSNAAEINMHYSDDFSFYKDVIGPSLCYTCADWSDTDDLATAQRHKMDKILRFANIDNNTDSIIDIGSGWGGTMLHAANKYPGIKRIDGVTISEGQADFCRYHFQDKRLNVHLQDVFQFLPGVPNDTYSAAVSIGTFEHLAGQKDYQKGQHIDKYRLFFEQLRRVIRGRFALQSIVSLKNHKTIPAQEVKEVYRLTRYIAKYIFPNAITPPLVDIFKALEGIYHIDEMEVNTHEYARTLHCWNQNLLAIKGQLPAAQYERFNTYFGMCEKHFASGYLGISRFSLVPVGR